MRLFRTVAGLRSYLECHRRVKKIGFVPTMGALHAGHLSLIERAICENEVVVVSIFVNPLQFEPTEDLNQYPRQLEEDRKLCEQLGVDVVFAPTAAEMGMETGEQGSRGAGENERMFHSPVPTIVVPPTAMTSVLCGSFRPGHFQGVATVVTKLLNIVQPTTAYFGEKDAQQLAILRRLVEDLHMSVEIRACPIVREPSGLAYSSRNQYLTPEQHEQALALSRSLRQAELAFRAGERRSTALVEIVKQELALVPALRVEYVELVRPTTLTPLELVEETGLLAIACHVGSTRLIDNVILRQRQPIVAIDGSAGVGKSTVARRVAQALGLLYLDTGAMYRALTWLVLELGISVDDEPAIAELASQAQIQLISTDDPHVPVRVQINGKDVTQAIRTAQVTANVSAVSAQPAVRRQLVKQQQRWGQKGGIVTEGRDIGTHVFPDAELKIFLTASAPERARRRQQDLKNQGQADVSLEQLEREIQERDRKDSSRLVAPLRKAADAIEINTDSLSIEEVTVKIISLYRQKLSASVQ